MVRRVVVVILICLGVVGPQASKAQTSAPAAPAATCPEMASALTALMRNDVRSRDWANLARYRDANRTLPSSSGL